MAKTDDLKTLLTQLQDADKAYYDAASEVKMSDDEYDVLRESAESLLIDLRKENSGHPTVSEAEVYFAKVGAEASTGIWRKRNHQIPMGSLSKVKGLEGLKEWWDKTAFTVR